MCVKSFFARLSFAAFDWKYVGNWLSKTDEGGRYVILFEQIAPERANGNNETSGVPGKRTWAIACLSPNMTRFII